MKSASVPIAFLTLALGALAGPLKSRKDTEIDLFEVRYLEQQAPLWVHSNSTVKLVGFQRANLDAADVDEIEVLVDADPELAGWFTAEGVFLDRIAREVRIYFPVRDALVYHKRDLVEANENGELQHAAVDGDMSVIGRFESDQVGGDASNIVRDGIVFLAAAHPVLHRRGNAHFYDFGTKRGHDHRHDYEQSRGKRILKDPPPLGPYKDRIGDPNKGCYANHRNQICSFAYPSVVQKRCGTPQRSETKCRDYNGWPVSSCSKKSKIGFVGSDCYYSLKKGHCWNEAAAGLKGDR